MCLPTVLNNYHFMMHAGHLLHCMLSRRWEVNAEGTGARLIKMLQGHTNRECSKGRCVPFLGLPSDDYPLIDISFGFETGA